MKTNKLMEMIKTNDLIVPNILLKNYKTLGLNEKELIFISFLMSYENLISFNLAYFSKVLSFTTNEIMEMLENLTSKKYIDMIVKEENGKMKEYLDITTLYDKLVLTIIDNEEDNKEKDNSLIYNTIEKEFGRTLSPIEYETISGWINSNISEELIKEALKEAVLNGVNNLKYIDKILYDWTKKGYKSVKDIKKKTKKEEKEIDLFDYDWLEDNE